MSAPVGFDNTFLSLLLNPNCRIPTDASGRDIPSAVRRAQLLVEQLGKGRQKIILPTPAAAELLTAVGPAAQQYYDIVGRSRLFEVAPFDQRCAIELAFLNNSVFKELDKKNKLEPYQKIKTDRQIVAILKVYGAETIYTDDSSLGNRASMCGIKVVKTAELPEPEQDRQMTIEFEAIDAEPGDAEHDEVAEATGRSGEPGTLSQPSNPT